MLLHLPTRRLAPEQFPSVCGDGDVLRRVVDAVAAPMVEGDGFDRMGGEDEPRRARPLLVRYEPNDPDQLVVPAIDSHSGGVSEFDAVVPVDHWVLFSGDEAGDGWDAAVEYPKRMRHTLRGLLPDRVGGRYSTGSSGGGPREASSRERGVEP
ncbi:hypothetical protein [Streptomyces sp. KHY 26]|uniref:hypothetical protein n=1 Tax=Streptomyces sp. KHY 26 TaxID=3097359 RepID=UPI00376EC03D